MSSHFHQVEMRPSLTIIHAVHLLISHYRHHPSSLYNQASLWIFIDSS